MLIILGVTFFISIILQDILTVQEHITTVFVFAVFLVSLITDGYLYGILTAFLGVIAVNFAFTFPYFAINFIIPENFISALVMIVISLMTSALTTKLKKWQEIKVEGEREKMRANLLRAVSHDLRTPLTTIYGSSSAIVDSYDSLSDDVKKKMVIGIKEDSQWLIGMVENLLSITRIDGGGVKLIKSPMSLEELADSVILKFKKRYPEINLIIDIPDSVVIIPMDAMLIEQVILNIFENAVYHADGMTHISFRVYLEKENAIFEISDNGCGIEKSRLDRIFDGYFSAEQRSDAKRRNAGIGLSVCSTIINAHGGSISAENLAAGGAVFRFSLSVADGNDIIDYNEENNI
ncbi:MAG: PAS domain-containing sensor histidine kinase [Clostridia bacterium]|nr:PAS domain-containing sensor histidine kinase [Clostridia bacterium]